MMWWIFASGFLCGVAFIILLLSWCMRVEAKAEERYRL